MVTGRRAADLVDEGVHVGLRVRARLRPAEGSRAVIEHLLDQRSHAQWEAILGGVADGIWSIPFCRVIQLAGLLAAMSSLT